MIVTIDGPAGAGKSSVARALARRLGFRFLDTGAMYRAVAWAALQRQVDWQNATQLAQLAESLQIELHDKRVLVDQVDVTQQIRRPEVTACIHYVADNVQVRKHLSMRQRQEARHGNVVTEGRDQGTEVFPDADCKIYLTASAEERARRRYRQMVRHGQRVELADLLLQQNERDRRDRERRVGRLQKADDAIELRTDGMTPEEVVARLEEIVRATPSYSREA